ncbi:MAG: methyltransferase domain-containing protein [Thermoplasmata archaeon]
MSKKDWFEDQWFWKDYRPVLFPRERLEKTSRQVDRFVELLALEKDAKILDLACGIGRHSLELARRGYDVTGLDLSEAYMKEASKKAEDRGLPVEFIQDDMRSFVREHHYHAVINFWSSFGYFEVEADNYRVIKNIHSSLKKGGRFLIDVMGKEILHRIYSERDWGRIDGGYFLEERFLKDEGEYLESNWILIKDGKVKEHKFLYKLYSKYEIKELLKRAGFSSIDIYGDLYRSNYGVQAERLIAVAKK